MAPPAARAKGDRIDRDLQWMVKFFRGLIEDKFYGEVVLKFESGTLVHVQKTESIKPHSQ